MGSGASPVLIFRVSLRLLLHISNLTFSFSHSGRPIMTTDLYVSSGVISTGVVVSTGTNSGNAYNQIVLSGGSAVSSDLLGLYSFQTVEASGEAIGTIIGTDAEQLVSSGGSAISANVHESGDQYVYLGGPPRTR